jgi:hypothetical protein
MAQTPAQKAAAAKAAADKAAAAKAAAAKAAADKAADVKAAADRAAAARAEAQRVAAEKAAAAAKAAADRAAAQKAAAQKAAEQKAAAAKAAADKAAAQKATQQAAAKKAADAAQAKLDAKNKPLVDKYAALGLTNASNYVHTSGVNRGLINEAAAQVALVRDVYGLDPNAYLGNGKPGLPAATALYQKNLPKITPTQAPTTFFDAVNNYSNALSEVQKLGIENINERDFSELQNRAKQIRDFNSGNLGPNASAIVQNSQLAIDKILQVRNQKSVVDAKRKSAKNEEDRKLLNTERENLQRLIREGNQAAPTYIESLSRFNLSDINPNLSATLTAPGITSELKRLKSGGLAATGGLAGALNINVSDQQILDDINEGVKLKYQTLYESGTAAATDLQSQLTQANQFLSSLPANDPRRASTQKDIDNLSSKLAEAQKDTLEAKNLVDNFKPITASSAPNAVTDFRKTLELPEEKTMAQIEQIDPILAAGVRSLGEQYRKMAETPAGPTTSASTEAYRKELEDRYRGLINQPLPETQSAQAEALRRDLEGRIASQVALGSQLGVEEQRQYEQATRSAQTARGNIFGVAPAVQEAVGTGLAAEQRLRERLAGAQSFLSSGQSTTDALQNDVKLREAITANRLGAAQGFLASGESVGAALARDTGLRNALDQSRLGAAQQFFASGPTFYNLSSQRLAQQQNLLNSYLAASSPDGTADFTATPTANAGYQYVNPNAALQSAQNASNIYGTMADIYKTGTQYALGTQRPGQTGTEQFAQIAGGIGSLLSPVTSAFTSYNLGGALPR